MRLRKFPFRTIGYGSATWDPGSAANGTIQTTTVTVQGARRGDFVMVAFPQSVDGAWTWTGVVIAVDTVRVVGRNDSGATQDLASGTIRVVVLRGEF